MPISFSGSTSAELCSQGVTWSGTFAPAAGVALLDGPPASDEETFVQVRIESGAGSWSGEAVLGQRCPHWDPHARGAWVGLSMDHTPADLRPATYEGVVFSLKSVLERLESLVGRQRSISVIGGGQGGDDRLVQGASIYDRPLAPLSTSEPTALGAMIVAGVGIGLFESVEAGVRAVIGADQTAYPDANMAERCGQLYELYRAEEAVVPGAQSRQPAGDLGPG